MIILQIVTLIYIKVNQQEIRVVNVVNAIVFIVPALAYIIKFILAMEVPFENSIPLILGIMMFVESLYALH